ncbi:SIMPL domain-containing protein [Nanoarchaeota archaeon]
MKKYLKIILGLLVIALIVGCVPSSDQRTVNTNGQANLAVEPDQAVVYVAIETLEDTAQASKDENARITDDVYAGLYSINIPKDDVESQNYNIYEEFDWRGDEGRESLGFRTSHTLKITTEEFDDVGEIIDAVINAGATRINYINFELSDEKQAEYKKQALTQASKDAREKAEAIAEGLGAKLGDIVSVSDGTYNYNPYRYYETGVADVAFLEEVKTTQISPQELEVSAYVQVVFQIK